MSIDQPQPTAPAPAERANGLATYFGVLFSPGEAFDTLARVPMWGWACILGIVITMIAAIVGLPVSVHLAQVAQQARLAEMPADQQQAARDVMGKTAAALPVIIMVSTLVAPWIGWLLPAVVVLAGAAIGRGVARFGSAWVLAVNAYAITGLGTLVGNIILRLQWIRLGPDSITKPSDAYVIPSPAMIVHGDPKMAAFLYAFNVLSLWYYVVLALGMQRVMKMSAAAAWTTSIVFAVLLALIAMAFAK